MSINSDDLRARVPPAAVGALRAGLGSAFDELSLAPNNVGAGVNSAVIPVTPVSTWVSLVTKKLTLRVSTKVVILGFAMFQSSTGGDIVQLAPFIDGALPAGATIWMAPVQMIPALTNIPWQYTVPAAAFLSLGPGDHTIELKAQMTINAGNNTAAISVILLILPVSRATS